MRTNFNCPAHTPELTKTENSGTYAATILKYHLCARCLNAFGANFYIIIIFFFLLMA